MGGETALHAIDRDLAAQLFPDRFRAATVYYPYCDIPAAPMTAPTLILIGEADEQCPVERCREMVIHARPDGAPIALTVYPAVYHNFDVALLTPGVRFAATGSNTMSRRPRTRKKRRAHSLPLILPRHLPASRRQSNPMCGDQETFGASGGANDRDLE
jgi:dienelactone hydrolase